MGCCRAARMGSVRTVLWVDYSLAIYLWEALAAIAADITCAKTPD